MIENQNEKPASNNVDFAHDDHELTSRVPPVAILVVNERRPQIVQPRM